MPREIEFRGWDIDNNRWVYGYYVKRLDVTPAALMSQGQREEFITKHTSYFIIQDGFSDWNMTKPWYKIDVAPESVGQWTGSYDNNKKKIYEGDICKASKPNSYLHGEYEVIWDEKRGRYCYKGSDLIMRYQVGIAGNLRCEIVGNNYEKDPEGVS